MGVGKRRAVASWAIPVWPSTVAGALLGAVLAALVMHSSTSTVEASALIRVDQPVDPNQIMVGTAAVADSQQGYLSGEIAYLGSPGFAAAVGKELDGKSPDVSAVQNGQSEVITLSATAAASDEAKQTVNAAIKVYIGHVQEQNRERGQAAIDALTGIINRAVVTENPDQATDTNSTQDPDTGAPSIAVPKDAGITDLDAQRLAIQVQLERGSGVQIVQPATETVDSGAPSWTLGAVGGGLLGGMTALAAALAWRRRSGTITSRSALDGQVDRVMLPIVPLTANTGRSDSPADIAVGRELYAQLALPRSGRIVVIGASTSSGSAEIARLVAGAASERPEVSVALLLDSYDIFGELEELRASGTPGRRARVTTTIVDGGSVGASPGILDVIASADQMVVVAMVGRDVSDAAHVAVQLARTSGVPVSAVFTRRKAFAKFSRRDDKGWTGHSANGTAPSASAPEHDQVDRHGSTVDGFA